MGITINHHKEQPVEWQVRSFFLWPMWNHPCPCLPGSESLKDCSVYSQKWHYNHPQCLHIDIPNTTITTITFTIMRLNIIIIIINNNHHEFQKKLAPFIHFLSVIRNKPNLCWPNRYQTPDAQTPPRSSIRPADPAPSFHRTDPLEETPRKTRHLFQHVLTGKKQLKHQTFFWSHDLQLPLIKTKKT